MNTVDIRYLAALIDAEGCIATPQHNQYCTVQLTAVNTHRAVLELIQSSLGVGEIVCPHPQTAARQACYTWRCINAPSTAHALRLLQPHLIVKKGPAALALELADRITHRTGRIGRRLSSDESRFRAALVQQIRATRLDWPETDAISLTWPYLAGFFDGEGSITTVMRQKYRAPILHVHITNTCVPLLEAIRDYTQVGIVQVTDRAAHSLPMGIWQLTGASRVQQFLLRVLPYLCIKQGQTVIALELLDRIISRTGRPRHRLLPAEIEQRVALAQAIQALKHPHQRKGSEV